jgi:hypothetical protein
MQIKLSSFTGVLVQIKYYNNLACLRNVKNRTLNDECGAQKGQYVGRSCIAIKQVSPPLLLQKCVARTVYSPFKLQHQICINSIIKAHGQDRYFSTTTKVGTDLTKYENKLIKAPNDTELVSLIIKNLLNLGIMPCNSYIEKARATLNSMINSLPLNDPIYKFLNNKLQVPFELKAKIRESKIYPDSSILWENLVSTELPIEWGGTYIYKQTQDNSLYVGSAISHAIRAISHRDQFQGDKPLFFHRSQMTKQQTLAYSIIHLVPNYYRLLLIEEPGLFWKMSAGQMDILMAFSLFPSRVLEQYLIDTLNPSLNKTQKVYHTYCKNWSTERLLLPKDKIFGSKPVDILSETGVVLFKATSAAEAKLIAGVRTQSLTNYINNTKKFKSKTLKENITFRFPDATEKDLTTRSLSGKLINTQELNLNGRSLSSLSPQFIYAFKQDKVSFEVFFSCAAAFKYFYPNSVFTTEKTRITKHKENNYYSCSKKTTTAMPPSKNGLLYREAEEYLSPSPLSSRTPQGGKKKQKESNLFNLARIILMRINLEESLKIEDGTLRYFAAHPDRPIKSGIRENTPQWVINIETNFAVLLASPKLLNYTQNLDPIRFNEGRIRDKDTGRVNNFNNLFVSPRFFELYVPEVKGTDIDFIKLTKGITAKFIDTNFLK